MFAGEPLLLTVSRAPAKSGNAGAIVFGESMKAIGPFTAGEDAGRINVAVQRPTVNLREAENLGEQLAAETRRNQEPVTFSKHATFGPKRVTHPDLE